MNLSSLVHVNTNYTRSINIERDCGTRVPMRPYIVTSRARHILQRIAEALSAVETQRAWALVGPYGSGKSAFGLFLSRLLGDQSTEGAKYARAVLKEVDEQLLTRYQTHLRRGRGFCSVILTGSPEPLGRRLLQALLSGAEAFFGGRPGRVPAIVGELRLALREQLYGTTDIVGLLSRLQESVKRAGGSGVLVLIDELGKFLEYDARHRGTSDIYTLQALAEHSLLKSDAPVVLIVLLHQAFELYGHTVGERLRNEWKKVQGRFESVPFLETTEQTLRVVHAALSTDLPGSLRTKVAADVSRIVDVLVETAAIPSGLPIRDAKRLFSDCYPLHPVSLLTLPTLCQRVAQNERTLFSYLGSQEPHGFLDSLSRLSQADGVSWIRPYEIYEYFIFNQPGIVVDSSTHRRWAEVTTALERLGDATVDEIEVVKTIGLLNIIGGQGGLKASEDILELCWCGRAGDRLKKTLKVLLKKSIIAYRRYSGEYRVWQGSDFDLDGAVREQRSQIARVDAAEVLNEQAVMHPIVARRHAIETGTMRYYSPRFVSAQSLNAVEQSNIPTILICLASSLEESDVFRSRLSALGGTHSCGVICENGAAIRDAVMEVVALQRVQRHSSELANDPVSQRELRDRLAVVLKTQKEIVTSIFGEPDQCEWVILGRTVRIQTSKELQSQLSEVFDTVYPLAPIIHNELINRDRPSSAAIAGRKKLLIAMLEHPSAEDLGIQKFPAEKAMYRALLKATGLHRSAGASWAFQPSGGSDTCRVMPAWNAVMQLLESSTEEPVGVTTIYETLAKPPFGIKAGVLPVFMLAIYQALNQELALFERGHFAPFLTQELLEGLLKEPQHFSLQRFRFDSIREELFKRYAEALTGETDSEANLISVVRPFAKFMVNLPDFTKRTKKLSSEAISIRDLFFASKTPLDLLFSQLPEACGVQLNRNATEGEVQRFFVVFRRCITELRVAYHGLLSDFLEMLKESFSLGRDLQLQEVRDVLRGRCKGLQEYTIDHQGLKAFIGRVIDSYGDESHWLISVASFLARKPPEKWTDDDVLAVQYRLAEFASRIRDLRRLQLHYEEAQQATQGDLEATLLRIVSTTYGERSGLITTDESGRQLMREHQAAIRRALDVLPTSELKLAMLALLANDFVKRDAAEAQVEVGSTTKGAAR